MGTPTRDSDNRSTSSSQRQSPSAKQSPVAQRSSIGSARSSQPPSRGTSFWALCAGRDFENINPFQSPVLRDELTMKCDQNAVNYTIEMLNFSSTRGLSWSIFGAA